MAYSTLAVHLLISAPGDIPDSDLAMLRRTISQWNLNMGRHVGVTVLPVSWTDHAAAEFGDRPQALLNGQIVEAADMVIALFCDRLGTPTGEAESGTAEEIRVLADAGKPVGVLANVCARPPLRGAALDERRRLDSYLDELRQKALVFEYGDDAALMLQLNNFLSRATGQFQQSVDMSKRTAAIEDDPSEGVWPRADVREVPKTDSRGRLKTERKWTFVLHNTSRGAASDVRFRLEDLPPNAVFMVHGGDDTVGTIPPNGEHRFPLFLAYGSPDAVECVVNWTDASGRERETRATVRT